MNIDFYFGVGGRFLSKSTSRFGVHVPTGLDFLFKKIPIDLFVEVGPIMDLVPSTALDLSLGIGGRYWF